MTPNQLTPRVLIGTLATSICILLCGCASTQTLKTAKEYIVESERHWAESVATGDPTAVERILADDYLGVDQDGNLANKAQVISDTRNGAKDFVSCHLNQVKVRFYGNTAIAQGDESWVRRSGEPRRGRFVWTDTWLRRNGRWQIVASEDLIAPEK